MIVPAEKLTSEHVGHRVAFWLDGTLVGGIVSGVDTEHYDSRVLVERGDLDHLYSLPPAGEIFLDEEKS